MIIILICVFVILATSATYPAEVEFPLLQAMSYFPYWDNSPLKKGEIRGSVSFYYSNFYTFNHAQTSFSDFEAFSTVVGFRYGLSKGAGLEVYLRHSTIFGGILDKFIEDFHRAFNLPDADRPLFPRKIVQYKYGDYFDYTGAQGGMSPLILAYFRPLVRSHGFRLSGRLSLGIPLSSKPGFSSGKPFVSAGVAATYKKKWFGLEFSNTISLVQTPSWLEGEDIRSQILYSRLEVSAFHFFAGLNLRTSAFKNDDVSDNAYQIYVGWRINSHLEFIFQEDFAPFNTTPDIGFNLRYRF
ncbi:MAG: DUF3187 family protein [bacterium]|nr:DUF3187 family protein [bacterium]